MGNQQTQPEILTQKYVLTQKYAGLDEPSEEATSRLYKSMRFFSPKDNFFLLDKLFFFDQSDAFEGSLNFKDTVGSNYEFYRQKIGELDGKMILYPRLSEENFSLRRQYLKNTLDDRLDPSAFLAEDDKYWLMCQTFFAVHCLHTLDLPHCNLKPSNILVTSLDQVLLTDLVLFKPHFFLNQDLDKIALCHPSLDERCYLAPERFLDSGKTEIINLKTTSPKILNILMKSDIFSLGNINKVVFSLKYSLDTRYSHIGLSKNAAQLKV